MIAPLLETVLRYVVLAYLLVCVALLVSLAVLILVDHVRPHRKPGARIA